MVKYLFIVVLLVCVQPVWAQNVIDSKPKQLLQLIQQSNSDTGRIKLQLQLAGFYLSKPGKDKMGEDSARNLIDQAFLLSHTLHSVKWQNESQRAKGDLYLHSGDFKNGKIYYLAVINEYRKEGNKVQEAGALTRIAKFNYDDGRTDLRENIREFRNAATIYKQLANNVEEANSLFYIGDAYCIEDKLDSAMGILKQSVVLYKSANSKYQYMPDYDLSSIYAFRSNLHIELLYLQEGERYLDTSASPTWLNNYYFNLSQAYLLSNFYDISIGWAQKGAKHSKLTGDKDYYYTYVGLIVVDYIRLGQPQKALNYLQKSISDFPPDNTQQISLDEFYGRCYVALHLYSKAEKCYLDMDRLFAHYADNPENKIKDDIYYNNFIGHYFTLAKAFITMDKFKEAGAYLKIIDTVMHHHVHVFFPPSTISYYENCQFKVDSAAGNYIIAIKRFERHTLIEDSVLNASNIKQIAEINIQYETERKNKNILLLQSQGNIQKEKLTETKVQRNVILGGTTMLFLITGLTLNGYRRKRRSVMKLNAQQKKINQQNVILEKLVSEKDILLEEKESLLIDKELLMKEVHHRVKNNLHMISSLLESQSAYLENEALLAVQQSQHRIQAISLIHQKLYVNEAITDVSMPVYLREIVSYLQASFAADGRIVFHVNLDPIELDVAQAVSVGLIVNEVVTNSLKYAFPDNKKGGIFISMRDLGGDEVALTVADNGVGLKKGATATESKNNNSLGMNLITGLSKNLKAKLSISSASGMEIALKFSIERKLTRFSD